TYDDDGETTIPCLPCGGSGLQRPTPSAPVVDDAREGCVGSMTPERATFFLRRFKRDEKMLGPHEQWALDYAIAALSGVSAPREEPEGIAKLRRELPFAAMKDT